LLVSPVRNGENIFKSQKSLFVAHSQRQVLLTFEVNKSSRATQNFKLFSLISLKSRHILEQNEFGTAG
jgi:hypothetical protein